MRRVAIEQAEPLALPATVATAIVLLLLLYFIRGATVGQLLLWLPTIVLVTWGLACSYPGSQVAAWAIWGGAIAIDLLAARRAATSLAAAATLHPVTLTAASTAANTVTPDTEDLPVGDDVLDPGEEGEVVLQHVVRVRDRDGKEYIHATLRGELGAGERRTTLYVGFCPPFAALPQVEAEVIEGPPGIAKVVQAFHNGAQVEVDLDEASLEPVTVTVEVAAYHVEGAEAGSKG